MHGQIWPDGFFFESRFSSFSPLFFHYRYIQIFLLYCLNTDVQTELTITKTVIFKAIFLFHIGPLMDNGHFIALLLKTLLSSEENKLKVQKSDSYNTTRYCTPTYIQYIFVQLDMQYIFRVAIMQQCRMEEGVAYMMMGEGGKSALQGRNWGALGMRPRLHFTLWLTTCL